LHLDFFSPSKRNRRKKRDLGLSVIVLIVHKIDFDLGRFLQTGVNQVCDFNADRCRPVGDWCAMAVRRQELVQPDWVKNISRFA
jgi:hypothetical protein